MSGQLHGVYAHTTKQPDYKSALQIHDSTVALPDSITNNNNAYNLSTQHNVNKKGRRKIKATEEDEDEDEQLSVKKNKNNNTPALSSLYTRPYYNSAAFCINASDLCNLYNNNKAFVNRRFSCISPNRLFITFQVFRI